jgi:hypothetical protein
VTVLRGGSIDKTSLTNNVVADLQARLLAYSREKKAE